MFQSIDQVGKFTLDIYRSFRDMLVFIYLSFRSAFNLGTRNLRPIFFTLLSQIYFTGFQALPLITFIAIATGSIIVLQSTAQLSLLGSQEMMGNILVVTVIRELGPLLTALIVIARSGTAVATELGSMQVNKEIEALRTMSIEPLGFVVLPRILGGVISLVCLAFYFNCIALIGGFLVGNLVIDLSFSFYLEVLAQALTPEDYSLNIIKNSLSGFIIFSIATYQGMNVRGAPHEVPMATTRAVVNSIMAVVAFNLSITIYIFARALA
ncbi:MAG: ABC transporter permease [Bacteriovoracaceae bacterium]|nr:ABC transporter permease [Bacteriovoracaceae bacterium]